MAQENHIQTNFIGGVFSPKMRGHIDFLTYPSSCIKLDNALVTKQGGASRRGGTQFIAAAKTLSTRVRILPFQFSTEQAYILELGESYMRFYREGIQIKETGIITGVTQANPGVVTDNAHPYSNGDDVTISDVVGMVELNGNTYTISNITANTYELSVDTTSFTPYISGGISVGSEPYEIVTPWGADEVNDLQFAQTADEMFIVHGLHAPRVLVRLGDADWTLNLEVFTSQPTDWGANNWPRCLAFYEQRLYYASTPNQSQTLWGSKSGSISDFTQGINDDDSVEYTIASGQVNSIVWLITGTNGNLILGTLGGTFLVTGSAQGEPITPTNIRIVIQSGNGSTFRLPKVIDSNVIFVERGGRVVRAMGYRFETDSYFARDLTILADHITWSGVDFIEYQTFPSSILWCATNDGRLIGLTIELSQKITAWHQHQIGGVSDLSGSPAKVESLAVINGTLGSNDLADELWLVVQRFVDGQVVRYIERLSQPILDEQIDQESGSSYVDSCLTLNNPVAITNITSASPPVVTAPDHGFSSGNPVKIRYVSGMTEVNQLSFIVSNPTTNTFELSGIDGSAYSSYIAGGSAYLNVVNISGLDHLDGETVSILADGEVRPEKVVSGGSITLDSSGSIIHVGLPYTSILTTSPVEAGSRDGTAQGKVKRISRAVIRVFMTLGIKAGSTEENVEEVRFRQLSVPLDSPSPLFTGDLRFDVPGTFNTEGVLTIIQNKPLPMLILAIVFRVKTNR